MRSVFLLVFGFWTAACVSTPVEDTGIRIIEPPFDLVENNIVRQRQSLAEINASVGDPVVHFSQLPRGTTTTLVASIESRLNRDLAMIYGADADEADRTYALFGEVQGNYLVYIVRVRSIQTDGAFTALKGLVYQFHPGQQSPSAIGPDSY